MKLKTSQEITMPQIFCPYCKRKLILFKHLQQKKSIYKRRCSNCKGFLNVYIKRRENTIQYFYEKFSNTIHSKWLPLSPIINIKTQNFS